MLSRPQLVTFWDGPVTWLERLCVASMVKLGHPVAIYTYGDVAALSADLNAEVRDAREMIPEDSIYHKYRHEKRYGMFANIFRLFLLKYNKGIWVDLDCYLLKPLTPENDYVFGLSSPSRINNAVLKFPTDCKLINAYIDAITADPLQIPWASFSRQIRRKWEILKGQSQPAPNFKTNIGPRALTYFVRKHDLMKYARAQEVYYPLLAEETSLLVQPEEHVSPKITSETIMIHVWRNTFKYRGLLSNTPPSDSYIGKACHELGITS